MRKLMLAALFTLPISAPDRTSSTPVTDRTLQAALSGNWAGVLEYRDYSEPATSVKRVDLPTWLSISVSDKSMVWKYTYDDGPNKILEEVDVVTFDTKAKTYSEASAGKPAAMYTVDGFESLKEGRGLLVLHGSGIDNGKPSETRVTLLIQRNLLEVTEDVRPLGSSESFAFRHLYRLTRAIAPASNASR